MFIPKTDILIGILFSILWSSAAIAAKLGFHSASPIELVMLRFLAVGTLLLLGMLLYNGKIHLPLKTEWYKIAIFGFLNTTVYLGCFFIAIKDLPGGLGNLFTSVNPLIILLLSNLWMKRKVKLKELIGMLMCTAGLVLATFPLLKTQEISITPVIIMLLGMFSFSLGNVYYSKTKFSLSTDSINAWQIIIGGIGLSPLLLFNSDDAYLIPDLNFWLNLLWLSVVVSIISVRLWFYLLKKDPVHASQWLYLAPVFGYVLSYLILGEAITGYAIAGTFVVIAGLILSKKPASKSTNEHQQ